MTDRTRGASSYTRFAPGIPTWLILLVMFVGGLCSLLALNTASAAAEVEQRGVVEDNALASDRQQQLERDLAGRQAPDALARTAIAIGLVPNPNPAFLRINADGTVTVLGQAMPAMLPPPPPAPATAVPKPKSTPTAKATPTGNATPTGTARKPSAGASAPSSRRPTSAAPARSASPRPTSTGGHG